MSAITINDWERLGSPTDAAIRMVSDRNAEQPSPNPYRLLWESTGFTASMFSLWIPLRLQAATPLEIPQEVKATSEVEDGVSTAPRTAQDQVRFIQASMGLTLLHLARVLNVERQTIYNWLQGEQAPVLQNRTRTRLNEIAGVAHQWNTLCSRPLGKLVTGLDLGGFTLLDLLSQTQLDDTAVKTAMQKLAQEIDSRKQRQQPHLRTSVLPPETMDDRVRRRATSIPLDDWPSGD